MAKVGLVFGLLLGTVLFSKEIFIVNEKTIVAICFVTFMYFAMSKYSKDFADGLDEKGKYVEFATDNLTFNVGDSIHVDFSKEEAYPLDDKENIGKF